MDFYVLGAHGPPYNISFMDPPFIPFQLVSRLIMGPYVMCPLCRLLISCLSQVASSGSPCPILDPQLAPQLGIKGVGSYPHIPLIPRPCPGPGLKQGHRTGRGLLAVGPYRALLTLKHTVRSLIPDLTSGYQP